MWEGKRRLMEVNNYLKLLFMWEGGWIIIFYIVYVFGEGGWIIVLICILYMYKSSSGAKYLFLKINILVICLFLKLLFMWGSGEKETNGA